MDAVRRLSAVTEGDAITFDVYPCSSGYGGCERALWPCISTLWGSER
jgi:hypothetical protein